MLQAGRHSEALLGQSSVWLEGRLASPYFPLDLSPLQRPVEWREKLLWAWVPWKEGHPHAGEVQVLGTKGGLTTASSRRSWA